MEESGLAEERDEKGYLMLYAPRDGPHRPNNQFPTVWFGESSQPARRGWCELPPRH